MRMDSSSTIRQGLKRGVTKSYFDGCHELRNFRALLLAQYELQCITNLLATRYSYRLLALLHIPVPMRERTT